jgi:hypothetical protein
MRQASDALETRARWRHGILASAFGFGVLRFDFRGSIEHVVYPARLIVEILPQAATLVRPTSYYLAHDLIRKPVVAFRDHALRLYASLKR